MFVCLIAVCIMVQHDIPGLTDISSPSSKCTVGVLICHTGGNVPTLFVCGCCMLHASILDGRDSMTGTVRVGKGEKSQGGQCSFWLVTTKTALRLQF